MKFVTVEGKSLKNEPVNEWGCLNGAPVSADLSLLLKNLC